MIGDRSTGTEIPMEVLTREESRPDASTYRIQPETDNESNSLSSSKSSRRASARPTYVPLPSPRTLAFDSTTSMTSSLPTISPTHLPPSPLANRAFPPPSPSNPLFSHPLHVLVVDDDALTRTLMRRMLERMGCDVTTAENGDLALRILLSPDSDGESSSLSCSNSEQPVASDTVSKFHIIFLDNQMPVLSGVKAIAKLRDLGRRDFVVGVTGMFSLMSLRLKGLRTGSNYRKCASVRSARIPRRRGGPVSCFLVSAEDYNPYLRFQCPYKTCTGAKPSEYAAACRR